MASNPIIDTLEYLVKNQLVWKPHEIYENYPWLMLRSGRSQYTIYTVNPKDLSALGFIQVPGFTPQTSSFADCVTGIRSPYPDELTPAVSYYVFAHPEPLQPDTTAALRAFAKDLPNGFMLENSSQGQNVWRLVLAPRRSIWLREHRVYAIKVPYRLQSFALRQTIRELHHIFLPEFVYNSATNPTR